jgi:hypothetical protein
MAQRIAHMQRVQATSQVAFVARLVNLTLNKCEYRQNPGSGRGSSPPR